MPWVNDLSCHSNNVNTFTNLSNITHANLFDTTVIFSDDWWHILISVTDTCHLNNSLNIKRGTFYTLLPIMKMIKYAKIFLFFLDRNQVSAFTLLKEGHLIAILILKEYYTHICPWSKDVLLKLKTNFILFSIANLFKTVLRNDIFSRFNENLPSFSGMDAIAKS